MDNHHYAAQSIRATILMALAGALLVVAPRAAEQPNTAAMNAADIVRLGGAPGGLCSVIGAPDAALAVAIAGQGAFTVQCLFADAAQRDQARAAIRAAGVYGAVSADTLDKGRLPYADNLINIVVIESPAAMAAADLVPEELARVLAPLGAAFIAAPAALALPPALSKAATLKQESSWLVLRKSWPADIDEWNHYLHGADGNPVAQDRVVGPPRHMQWVSEPKYQKSHETDSSISSLVTSRGRLFTIEDQSPTSLEGDVLPDKWFVVARDAFNGTLLWQRPIERWGWREWKNHWFAMRPGDMPLNRQKRLVAAGDRLYVTLGYHAPVSQLDAVTGKILQTYADTDNAAEILHLDGTLVLSILSSDTLRVMAVNTATGKPLWTSKNAYAGSTVDYLKWNTNGGKIPIPRLDPSLNTATDGKTIAFIDGPDVVALDFRTGAEKWRAKFPQDPTDLKAGGVNSLGNLWIGTMIVSDGVVVHASPGALAGLDANTGKTLWTQPKKYLGHLWYEWKDVFVIDGLVWTYSAELAQTVIGAGGKKPQREQWPETMNGYDIRTGAIKKQVPLGSILRANHHHRCYRNKATVRYIITSRRGTEFIDLEGGQHTVDNWVRGMCHLGMMPANGLHYAPPHACQCYVDEKLNGMTALAPAGSVASDGGAGVPPAVERGPAFGSIGAGPQATPQDWPMYRYNSMRDGSSGATVPDAPKLQWRIALGGRVSPPIVVGDRLYAALVDQHHVVCLDVKDGKRLWEFAAGARVDSPPAYWNGALIFGSADGSVYCLRAADGQLAWRFRAAPAQRLIAAFGQLESAWPINGSVLAQNNTVYFAAGRSSQLDGGLQLFGLEAATGKLLHQTKLEGPRYTVNEVEENFKLPMGALPDILAGDGQTVFMRALAFDASLKQQKGSPTLQARGGFLDDSYSKRMPWIFGAASDYANLIVKDDQFVYFGRMFNSLKGLDPNVYFEPGAKGYQLFSRPLRGDAKGWSERIPLRMRAMALTPGRLLVTGPPDVVDREDPLGAFEGRKGGLLYVVDTAVGKPVHTQTLPAPPVFNGIAAANGHLYVADESGAISCFGQ